MEELIRKIESYVRDQFFGEGTGHDWYHIDRVRKNALRIAEVEGGNQPLIILGALLHDIADHKFHENDLSVGPTRARDLILQKGGDAELADKVRIIVSEVSFKGSGVETPVSSLESAIVQDADRLDALGAIGIARTFAYGGKVGSPIHDPLASPKEHHQFEAYANSGSSTIHHFYEKLLLLKDRMQTATGRNMAEIRHVRLELFLRDFYKEWEGNDLA